MHTPHVILHFVDIKIVRFNVNRLTFFIIATLISVPIHAEESKVADALTHAATYIYDDDFLPESPEKTFSRAELELLESQKDNLARMIERALGRGNSVGGADLVAYFKLYESVPNFRFRFLVPGRTYGWEGPDYSDTNNNLTDNQYVYHSRYYHALASLFGDKVPEALNLDDRDKLPIINYSQQPESIHYYWALWMHSKLQF